VVYWASLHDAEAAAKASEGSEQCAPMFALIEMESALFLHGIPAITPVVEHGPHRLVMRTAQGPFPMETTYIWQPEDASSTRMTLRTVVSLPGSPK
jgi:hypothetical protein